MNTSRNVTVSVVSTEAAPEYETVQLTLNGTTSHVAKSDSGEAITLREALAAIAASSDLPELMFAENVSNLPNGKVTIVRVGENGAQVIEPPTTNLNTELAPGTRVFVGKDVHNG